MATTPVRSPPGVTGSDEGYGSRANQALQHRRGTVPEPRDQQVNRRRRGCAGGHPVGLYARRHAHRIVVKRNFCQVEQSGLATG